MLELQVAVSKFDGLAVRPHLGWLFSLRGSDVFSNIWKSAARLDGARDVTLRQESVVSQVIPKAKASWEALAKRL